MPALSHVLIDTNALWGIKHPDFQKMVQLSRERRFRLVVPHIVWEERRTQMLDQEKEAVKSLQSAYDRVVQRRATSMLGRLMLPPLHLWESEQMAEASKEHMVELARLNNIEVIPLDPAHAMRTWERYFEVEMPFKREESRENRRRDIPDSWIFEAAIELYHREEGLVALCGDAKLQRCFDSIGVPVYKQVEDFVMALEEEGRAELEPDRPSVQHLDASDDRSELSSFLTSAQTTSLQAERTILGVVGYLKTVPKVDLVAMMATLGLEEPIVRNAAERLALHGLIRDTGSAYIPKNRQACDLAAAEIEPTMIRLVIA